jgi:hypothetical protein
MTIQTSIKLATASVIAVLMALFFVSTLSVSAHEGEEAESVETTLEETESTEASEGEEATAVEAFEYTAQPGDSYSLMARKAVQTSGFETSTNLSEAQIIFVETNLTVLAGSPKLNLGEKVSISKELVKQWSEKAKELTEAQKARWQVYANNANFNTDAVGEARE